jgi:hypothetical protein
MPEGRQRGGGRFSAKRKLEAVLRILRGEHLDTVSRELGVTAATLSSWRDDCLSGAEANLKSRAPTPQDDEVSRLQGLVGDLTMRLELSRERSASSGSSRVHRTSTRRRGTGVRSASSGRSRTSCCGRGDSGTWKSCSRRSTSGSGRTTRSGWSRSTVTDLRRRSGLASPQVKRLRECREYRHVRIQETGAVQGD